MAAKTLWDWRPSHWPADAAQALTNAARDEPADETRQAMAETLASAGIKSAPVTKSDDIGALRPSRIEAGSAIRY